MLFSSFNFSPSIPLSPLQSTLPLCKFFPKDQGALPPALSRKDIFCPIFPDYPIWCGREWNLCPTPVGRLRSKTSDQLTPSWRRQCCASLCGGTTRCPPGPDWESATLCWSPGCTEDSFIIGPISMTYSSFGSEQQNTMFKNAGTKLLDVQPALCKWFSRSLAVL